MPNTFLFDRRIYQTFFYCKRIFVAREMEKSLSRKDTREVLACELSKTFFGKAKGLVFSCRASVAGIASPPD